MSAEPVRLNKAIASAGLASRREADRLIQAGVVRVNGEQVDQPGRVVTPHEDTVEVEGRRLRWAAAHAPRQVWALYKPKRVVSTLDDPEGRPCLAEYLPRTSGRLFPIGRLDYDAEGLILLTNDGELAQHVAHPAHSVRKVYLVKVKGLVSQEAIGRMERGVRLDGRVRKGARVRLLHNHNDKTWLEVTLREGIQRHIHKLFAAVGYRVLKIKRYQVGPVELADLEAGQARRLTAREVEALLAATAPAPQGEKRGA